MPSYEAYGKPDVERALLVMFDTPPYYDYYQTIAQKYRYFEFADELTDEQRMGEYAQVYQQLRKYIGTKQATIMSLQENLPALREWISKQLDESDIYPKQRVALVYNSLKVDWLRQAANQVDALIDELNGGM